MSGINVPDHYVKQFATNIELLLQQKDSRLRSFVKQGSHKGKSASPVDQVGAIEMQPVVGRFNPMGRVDAPLARRWVDPSSFDLPQLLDSFDELKLLIDPKSTYVMNAVAAAKRQMDRLLITAFFGAAKTGEEGGTSTSFPAGQVVAVNQGSASNTGMTVAKLRKARQILLANEVDPEEPIFMAINSIQHDNLLAEAKVVSTDFNDKPVLVDGKVTRFMGINFIHTELLAVDGSSYRRNPVWVPSGMHLGVWSDIHTSVSTRNDIQGEPWQAYVKMTMGATRLDEKKVVEIKSAE